MLLITLRVIFYALARSASLQTSCQWNVCKCRCYLFIINHFLCLNWLMFFYLPFKDSVRLKASPCVAAAKGLICLSLNVLSVRTNAALVQFPVLNSILRSKASLCWGELHSSVAVFLVVLPPWLPRLLETRETLLLKGCMTQGAISPGSTSCGNSHNRNDTDFPTRASGSSSVWRQTDNLRMAGAVAPPPEVQSPPHLGRLTDVSTRTSWYMLLWMQRELQSHQWLMAKLCETVECALLTWESSESMRPSPVFCPACCISGAVAIFLPLLLIFSPECVHLCTVAWKLLRANIPNIMILCFRKNESSLHSWKEYGGRCGWPITNSVCVCSSCPTSSLRFVTFRVYS